MQDLKVLRQKIDKIDKQLLALLRARMAISKQIGKAKKIKKLPITNKKREKIVLSKLKTPSEKAIFKKIISESKKVQKSLMRK